MRSTTSRRASSDTLSWEAFSGRRPCPFKKVRRPFPPLPWPRGGGLGRDSVFLYAYGEGVLTAYSMPSARQRCTALWNDVAVFHDHGADLNQTRTVKYVQEQGSVASDASTIAEAAPDANCVQLSRGAAAGGAPGSDVSSPRRGVRRPSLGVQLWWPALSAHRQVGAGAERLAPNANIRAVERRCPA